MRALAALALAAVACARATPAPPAPPPAEVATVAAAPPVICDSLRRDLSVFASDSFMGRSADSPDGVRAARFLAARLRALGLEPAGDSGYFQRVPMSRQYLGRGSSFTVTTARDTTRLTLGARLVPLLSLADSAPRPRLSASGELVFAGYGIDFPGYGRNDLAKLDVEGKVVAFVNDAPRGLDSARAAALREPAMLGRRLGALMRRRPAAIVVLATGRLARELPILAMQLGDSALRLEDSVAPRARELPMVLIVPLRYARPFLPPGWPANDRARPLAARHFAGTIDLVHEERPAYNVAALVRGSDSALARSYVAFGAHLDHIGVQQPEHGDSIANGADDDGSGSVALLQIAAAAMRAPARPRRSMLFVWHTGEELGLYGSEWFTAHPTVPMDSIVAQLNADMIGRNDPDSLYLIGPRQAPNGQSTVLGAIIDSVNASLARPFLINREWDSPMHPEQLYYRSDHYNYAKRGVPIVFFTTGLHADYHRVTDDPAKIDYEKLARVVDLLYRSGVAVANRATRPLPERSRVGGAPR